MRTLEILWIVLFRFRPLPRLWAIALILVNAGALFFLNTPYGLAVLGAAFAGIAVMAVIHARLGFVRLLGIGHAFWIPILIWFAADPPDRTATPLLHDWVMTVIVFNMISLAVDAVDVGRYVAGDRDPHYVWAQDTKA